MDFNSTYENLDLKLADEAKGFLQEIGKWAFFLSIIGYIGIALMLLFALFAGSILALTGGGAGAMGGGFLSALYIIMSLLYFFPVYYLNKFATNIKNAIATNDSLQLSESFRYLKSHYKFIGILTIVMLSLYLAIIIFAIVAGGASAML